MSKTINIEVKLAPIGKPRMTRRDRWAKRPAVLRYYAWKDELLKSAASEVEELKTIIPDTVSIFGWFPHPKAWSMKKKLAMVGAPHNQKPDYDNIAKAVTDTLFEDDKTISTGFQMFKWDDGGGARMRIIISGTLK